MRSEPHWVEYDDLVFINERVVAASDEPHTILNESALRSAAISPRNHWHYEEVDDVAELAARLCISVARAHGFIQGNKRTAFIGSTQFLLDNGFLLDVPDVEEIAELIEDVVEHKQDDVALVKVYDEYTIATI